jgi:GT2 family glycosyltransferase
LSQARFVLLLNPDTVVNETALERMVKFAEQNKRAGVVGCMLKLRNGTVQRSWYSFPNPLNFFHYHSVSSLLFEPINASFLKLRGSLGISLKPRSVDWLMGSCLLMRREALDDVGLLDPGYFMYFEDTDWCRRAGRRGWKAYYLPDVSIIHLHKRSSVKRRRFTLVRLFKSLLRYYEKYNSPASTTVLKFVVTADMLVRFAAFEMIRLLRPTRAADLNERQAAVKEILNIYRRGDV